MNEILILAFLPWKSLSSATPMNDLPVIGYPCMGKELWDLRGQTLHVPRSKCVAKSCSDVQKKTISGSDQRFFVVDL